MGLSSLPLLEKVISEIDRRGILLNTIATNSLIIAMATCGLLDEAFQVYFDMSKRQQRPDVSTFTALLSVCARDKQRGMERVLHVWQEMRACGIEPDLVTFNTLLWCLKVAGVPEEMIHHGDLEVTIPGISTQELHFISQRKWQSFGPDEKGGRNRSYLRNKTVRVVSKAQVNLCLSSSVLLTIHLTSGWRWLDPAGVEQFLCLLKDSGLVPDIHTLNYLSQMASDWTAVARDVGVASSERGVVSRSAIPDKQCLISAARLQALLGNRDSSEVKEVEFSLHCTSLALFTGYSCIWRGVWITTWPWWLPSNGRWVSLSPARPVLVDPNEGEFQANILYFVPSYMYLCVYVHRRQV